jgi:hypothetical protein
MTKQKRTTEMSMGTKNTQDTDNNQEIQTTLRMRKGVDGVGLVGVLTEVDPIDFKPAAVVFSRICSDLSSILFFIVEDA